VSFLINRVTVGSSTTFPAELSYDVPTDGAYGVTFIVQGGAGNALMDIGCSRP
jgi:hypothetical protein